MKRVRSGELREIIVEVAVKGRLPIMIWGAPGIGKSHIVREAASSLGMPLLDMRLNYYEESDFLGIPMRTERGMEFVKYAKLPREGSGIWFLDELTHARTSIQGLIFQLINDGAIEDYKVPDGWMHFVAASNLPSHRSISNQMPAGLYSRFTGGHYELVPDIDDWASWAITAGVDNRIISFLQYMEKNDQNRWLYRDQGDILITPRLWATGVNHAITSLTGKTLENAIMGMIGEDAGAEFIHFIRLAGRLPDIEAIAAGDTGRLSESMDASEKYLIVSGLAKLASRKPEMLTGCLRALFSMNDEYAALGVGMLMRTVGRQALMQNYFLISNVERFHAIMGVADEER